MIDYYIVQTGDSVIKQVLFEIIKVNSSSDIQKNFIFKTY